MDRRSTLFFLVAVVLILLRYVVIAFHVHPFADDFSYAVAGMHNPLLKRLVDEYHFWNGRWFSNILVLRGPLVLGLHGGLPLYRMVPVLLLVLLGGGAYALVHAVAPSLGRLRKLGVVLVLLALFLHLLPDLSEGVYWYTGAVTYLLPNALLLFLLAVWLRIEHVMPTSRPLWLVLAVVLICCIAGCNELHMVYLVLFHGFGLLLVSRHSKRLASRWVIGLVVACIAAVFMITAPGNAGRAAQFPLRADVMHTVYWGALQTGRFLLTWMASPAFILFSLIALHFLQVRMEEFRSRLQGIALRPRWVLVLMVSVVFISMALPYWSTGLLGQHRTVNATLVPFLVLWCWFLLGVARERAMARRPSPLGPRMQLVAVLLLAVSLAFTGVGGRLTGDLLSGAFPRFDAGLHDRYLQLEEAAVSHSPEVQVPTVLPPDGFRYLDGTSDPGHWINRSIMQYFGADDTRLVIGKEKASTTPVASR